MTPLLQYFGRFKKPFKESIMAFAFNLFGIAAGTLVALNLGLFKLAPWAIVVYPAIISANGAIGGLISGRLSTGLHLGTILPRFFGNTRSFYILLQAIAVLTLEICVFTSAVASFFGSYFWGATFTDFFNILGVILMTVTLAFFTITPITMTVSGLSFKRGLDPDIILYPVGATVSDLFVTLWYFLVLNLFFSYGSAGQHLVVLSGLILPIIAPYFFLKNIKEKVFLDTIKESILTMVSVAFIVNVTGTALGKISEVVGRSLEIYVTYPALITTIGGVGAVVGSTATTKLALGTIKSTFFSIKDHTAEIFSVWGASLIMFTIYSVLSLIIQGIFSPTRFLNFTALLFTANVIAALLIIIISYTVAIITFQKSLDPDNFVIPIESSLADGLTTISLLVALTLIS